MKCCCRCGRLVAEFDNHADGCRSCKGCSVDNKCDVLVCINRTEQQWELISSRSRKRSRLTECKQHNKKSRSPSKPNPTQTDATPSVLQSILKSISSLSAQIQSVNRKVDGQRNTLSQEVVSGPSGFLRELVLQPGHCEDEDSQVDLARPPGECSFLTSELSARNATTPQLLDTLQ